MNVQKSLIVAFTLCLALAAPVLAQSGSGSGNGTSGQSGTPGTTATPDPSQPGTTSPQDPNQPGTTTTQPPSSPYPPTGTTTQPPDPYPPTTTTGTSGQTSRDVAYDNDENEYNHEWIVSGFVGGNWGQNSLSSSVDFGGTVDYLYRGAVGAEFLAGFSPKFNFNRLVTGQADVNNYMVNAIAAIPVGSVHGFRPFVSGGVGLLTLSLNDNAIFPTGTALGFANGSNGSSVFDPNASHFAGNIGVGVMAFAGRWGIRGDLRYFSSIGTNTGTGLFSNTTGGPSVASTGTLKDNAILNDVKFWRANIGVAFRF